MPRAALDPASGLTLTAYTTAIADAQGRLDAYNAALSAVESAYTAALQSRESPAELTVPDHHAAPRPTAPGVEPDQSRMGS